MLLKPCHNAEWPAPGSRHLRSGPHPQAPGRPWAGPTGRGTHSPSEGVNHVRAQQPAPRCRPQPQLRASTHITMMQTMM